MNYRAIITALLALLGCLGLAGTAAAAQGLESPPHIELGEACATPPRIDGKLDDPCWRTAAQVTGFLLTARRENATEQTTVYVTYDRHNLYVAFECLESHMALLSSTVTERDGPVFKDDSVALLLDPNRDRFSYYEFAVNPRGTRLDIKGDASGANPGWDAPWDAACSQGEDRWWAEMAIPFSSLDIELGRTGDTWGINFAREEKCVPESSVWSFTGGKPAQPDRFGKLSNLAVDFSRYAYSVEVVDTGEKLVGSNAAKARIRGAFPGAVLAGVEVYLPDGRMERKQVLATLQEGEPALVVLPYSLPHEGQYRMVVRVRDPKSLETLHATGVSVSVPPLLEAAIFPNHYRQEVWLRPRLNMRQEDLKDYRMTVRLLKNGVLVPPVREKPFFTVKEPSIPFDLSQSGPGEYTVQVTLLPRRGGTGLVRTTLKFTQAPLSKNPMPPASVVAEKAYSDNCILVKGRRFFPIGLFPVSRLPDNKLQEAHDSGFNMIQVPLGATIEATRSLLDRAEAHSLGAWVSLGDVAEAKDEDVAAHKKLRDAALVLAKHPALLCWQTDPEPAWRGADPDDFVRGYALLRTLDPDHPVWTSHAPRNTLDELALFNRGTDIAGASIYPVPASRIPSDESNRTISVVGDETSKNVLAVLNRKPVFMVLQGFAWQDLAEANEPGEVPVYPTFAQERFMAYDAVVRGARGLVFNATNVAGTTKPFWKELRRLAYELSQMADVLAGPDTTDVVQADAKGIETLVRRHPTTKDRFIIAVNTTAQPQNVRLQIPGAMPKVRWRVLFEQRSVVGNPIVDRFAPYDVHIYTASTSFPEERFLPGGP